MSKADNNIDLKEDISGVIMAGHQLNKTFDEMAERVLEVVDQHYILKSRVATAIGEDEVVKELELTGNMFKTNRNQLRAEIKKELGI